MVYQGRLFKEKIKNFSSQIPLFFKTTDCADLHGFILFYFYHRVRKERREILDTNKHEWTQERDHRTQDMEYNRQMTENRGQILDSRCSMLAIDMHTY